MPRPSPTSATPGFSIRVIGAHRVANRLRGQAARFPRVTDRITGKWAKATRAKLKAKKYPPKIPGQKYVRTGILGSSWKATRQKAGSWAIENWASQRGKIYSHWVINRGTQAGVHEGRWWTGQDVIDEEVPALTKELADELSSLPD